MTITQIEPMNRTRRRVSLDGEFAFVLYKGELSRFRLKEGDEISEEIYAEITQKILPKRATLRAMHLLEKRTMTTYQLRQKLSDGEYPPDAIEYAIEYVSAYHYLDDRKYAEEYIRIHISDKSRRRIKQDLMQKGIGAELIEEAFDANAELGFEQDEVEQARRLLVKRRFNPETATYEEKQKEAAFLARKGYPGSVIWAAIGSVSENQDY